MPRVRGTPMNEKCGGGSERGDRDVVPSSICGTRCGGQMVFFTGEAGQDSP